MLSTSKFFFEIPVDILFNQFRAKEKMQNNRSLDVWLALMYMLFTILIVSELA